MQFSILYVLSLAVVCLQGIAGGFLFFTKSPAVSSRLHSSRGFGMPQAPFKYTGNVRPGQIGAPRIVPKHIMFPDYALTGQPKTKRSRRSADILPTPAADIELMRVAGRYAREVLDIAIRAVQPGVTTDYIDQIVHEATIERNSYPSPLNYHGFPKSCCTSVNEVICHGIPDSTVLKDGDIINIDVTVYYQGVHGDCSETVLVGQNVSPELKDLVKTTYLAWQAAVDMCRPGVRYSQVGGVIEEIASRHGYTSVKEFCGHGISSVFHDNPSVLHYRNEINNGVMAPGHTFTIEPMICMGKSQPVIWPDKWTATTPDGLPSAQFEHTLLITEDGVDALTKKLPTSPKYFWE